MPGNVDLRWPIDDESGRRFMHRHEPLRNRNISTGVGPVRKNNERISAEDRTTTRRQRDVNAVPFPNVMCRQTSECRLKTRRRGDQLTVAICADYHAQYGSRAVPQQTAGTSAKHGRKPPDARGIRWLCEMSRSPADPSPLPDRTLLKHMELSSHPAVSHPATKSGTQPDVFSRPRFGEHPGFTTWRQLGHDENCEYPFIHEASLVAN